MKAGQLQALLKTWKQLTSGSINRQILGAAIAVGSATAMVKLLAFAKEAIVAWRFGTGDAIDAFLIAFLVPSFIISVVAESLNASLIPTYIQVREQEGIEAAKKLFSGSTVWGIGLLGITTLLMVITAPIYLSWIANGFHSEKLKLTLHLLWAIAPTVLISGIVTLWSAVLNAGERFVLTALCPMTIPAITILLLLAFPAWGAFALASGLVLGSGLQLVFLGVALHRQGISLYPRWYGFDTHLRQVAGQYAPMIAGALLICSTSFVDQSMAAILSPGSVAALNYGNRAISFAISLAATALSTAVIPFFSKMVAYEDWIEVHRTLKRYLWLIFAITVPATGLLMLFSEPVVQLLFQRGAFQASDTHLVAQIQTCFAVQIPFYIANIVVVRLLSSMRLNHILMWASGFDLLINTTLNYLFMQWIGIKGIALSTSFVYVFTFFYSFFAVKRNLRRLAPAPS